MTLNESRQRALNTLAEAAGLEEEDYTLPDDCNDSDFFAIFHEMIGHIKEMFEGLDEYIDEKDDELKAMKEQMDAAELRWETEGCGSCC